MNRRTILAGLLAAVLPAGPVAAAAPSYEQEIAPILRTYCSGCHNDRDLEGELSVERFASLRKGGAGSGDPVVPGDAAASELIRRIESTDGGHMPPEDEPQVPAAQLATLKLWIAAGAPGPANDLSILQSLAVPRLPPHAGIKPVTAAAVSPDGGQLAVARGRTVDLHDLQAGDLAGRPRTTLTNLPGTVAAVHFSRDGKRLVIAGGITGLSGVAELRDAATGAVIRSFGGHRDLLYDAELSPDEQTLATAGYDRSIKLWNVADGSLARSIDVHNGAVFDLAWHPTGKVLASASADETVKLWRPADGARLDTLKEPLAEVFAVAFTSDGGHVLAAGRDKRIHLWKLVSLDAPAINPPLHSRFAHESPIVAFGLSADGRHLLTSAEDKSLKSWSVPELMLEHDLPRQPDLVSAIVPLQDGRFTIGRLDGSLDIVSLPPETARQARDGSAAPSSDAAGRVPAEPAMPSAAGPIEEREANDSPRQAMAVAWPAAIKGGIGRPGDADCFRFTARRGEPLLLEVNAARSKSKLDSRLEILDAVGNPVERVVLQAVRDSWFTFRGMDSSQTTDFRLQNWTEMELDEYLYASGEVVRLWRYPEGPDSGYSVYPGEGNRHTFFGTSPVTHALGEPAWIVVPLPHGSRPAPNGLPVFPIHYDNDDDPTRQLGTDSQLLFDAPADGEYIARITDVRGFGAEPGANDYGYELAIRPPRPSFAVTINANDKELKVSPGSGRSLVFSVKRREGFEGPVRIDIEGLPAGFRFHGPIEIEAGQRRAMAVLSAAADAADPDESADKAVTVRATATIEGREVVHEIGTLGNLRLGEKPKVTLEIQAGANLAPATQHPGEPLEFSIRPGQTITAKVKATRHGFQNPIDLGRGDSGRNLPHGVFVDNIGLNGLLIVEGQDEREFFITAAPIAKPSRRLFHVQTSADGGQASPPVWITVLPVP
jgi:hypothetical protein